MSRAGAREDREPGDAYYTPPWAVRAFLPTLLTGLYLPSPRLRVLEPSCGHGNILRELRAFGVPDKSMCGIDLNPEAVFACVDQGFNCAVADFLTLQPVRRFDLVVGNPPYTLAEEFVRQSMNLLKTMGRCALLLRLNFLEGQKRSAWLRAHVPDVYVLPRRPSFYAEGPKKGKTDGTAYAWMVFHDEPRPAGEVRVLDLADCAD